MIIVIEAFTNTLSLKNDDERPVSLQHCTQSVNSNRDAKNPIKTETALPNAFL
ncbi:hypothetical protein [Chryseobacterium taeanense]|uniref:hypothetical protein n=1 Tax=Chryseobacterium taeanense TaxID=311334 RepID=UPI0035ADD4A5